MLIEPSSSVFPPEWHLPPVKNWKECSVFNISGIFKKIEVVPVSGCLEFTGKSLTTSKTINGIREKILIRHLMYALFFEKPPKGYTVEQTCKHISVCLHPEHQQLVLKK